MWISLEKIRPDAAVIGRLLSAAKRNIADYSGDIVPASAVEECVSHAEALLKSVLHWLNENKPELLGNEKE